MRLRHIASCVLGAAASALLPAYSAPLKLNLLGGGTDVSRSRSIYYATSSYFCDDKQNCVELYTQVFDNAAGVMQGSVAVYFYDSSGSYSLIGCNGPEYGNITSMVWGNGNTIVSAILDPSAPGCYSENASGPVTINLSGQANGNQSDSRTGVSTFALSGVTYKQNFSSNAFAETFYGTIGSISGSFYGSSFGSRNSARQRVK